MSLSATRLGERIGLKAQEVNYLLKEKGLIEGEPGAYGLTEEGKKYAHWEGRDNGYGGYAKRAWDWLEWDESIIDHLNISENEKQRITEEVLQLRTERRKKKNRESEEYWERMNATCNDNDELEEESSSVRQIVDGLVFIAGIAMIIRLFGLGKDD